MNIHQNPTSTTENNKNGIENKPPASENKKDEGMKQNSLKLVVPTSINNGRQQYFQKNNNVGWRKKDDTFTRSILSR